MSAFSWRDDFRKVQWGATIHLNVLRAFAAGVVWAVILLLVSGTGSQTPDGTPWWAIPFIAGLGYVFFVPCFFLAAKLVTTFAGDAGELGVNLGTFVLGLAIALGDPLVFLLHRRKSTWVPVEKFRPINVALVLFVMDPAKVALQSA